MKEMLGDAYEAFIKSYDQPPVKSLRINRRRIPKDRWQTVASALTGAAAPEDVPFTDGAYYYTEDGPGKHPLHEAGACYIQEASAMLPVTMLGVDPSGQKVLDLCAAPGGKSTQIADLMDGAGLLVANEPVGNRAKILSENIERMGIVNALVVSEDPAKLAERFPSFFDRILVDAPCSGEGMFRKNPEAVNEWSPENVRMCAERQDMILDCASRMLAPGGRIVYSTCTFSPEEDEGSVERFLSRHPEYTVVEGPTRLYPHTCRGEGHFAAALERISKESTDAARYSEGCGSCPTMSEKAGSGAKSFRENLVKTPVLSRCSLPTYVPLRPEQERERVFEGTALSSLPHHATSLITFGDSVYLAPEYMPDISGLKVLRAGLKLGSFKKDRFEPDHALSHAITAGDAINAIDLASDSPEIRQYLAGMTLNCDKDMKGWCLVTVDGLGIGWGKASNGVLKNHYPKGLRRAFA